VAGSSNRALELLVEVGECLVYNVAVGVNAAEFRLLQIGNLLSQPELSTSWLQGAVIC
jgi:hypothetical protein